ADRLLLLQRRRPRVRHGRRPATDLGPHGAHARASRRAYRRHALGHLVLLLQRRVAVAKGLVVQSADHEPALDLSRRPRAALAARTVRRTAWHAARDRA